MNLARVKRKSACVMSSAWRPGRFVGSCKRQDLVGELSILAAEVMPRANLLAPQARLMQARTYAVLFAFPVNTQDGRCRKVCQLRPGRQPRGVVADPVRNADLE